MTTIIPTILAIVSVSIHMWGEYRGPDILITREEKEIRN